MYPYTVTKKLSGLEVTYALATIEDIEVSEVANVKVVSITRDIQNQGKYDLHVVMPDETDIITMLIQMPYAVTHSGIAMAGKFANNPEIVEVTHVGGAVYKAVITGIHHAGIMILQDIQKYDICALGYSPGVDGIRYLTITVRGVAKSHASFMKDILSQVK